MLNYWMKFTFSIFMLCILHLNAKAEEEISQPQRSKGYWQKHINDPALARLYHFNEKKGFIFRDDTPKMAGTMSFLTTSPYGHSRDVRWRMNRSPLFDHKNPERAIGRWAGKMSVTPGFTFPGRSPNRNVTRTGYSGSKNGVITLAAWIRLHQKGVCSLFNIENTLIIRNNYGKVYFKYGKGILRTEKDILTPKVWHQLICQWDGKTMRVFLDGKIVGENIFEGPAPEQPNLTDNPYAEFDPRYQVGGLSIGGASSLDKVEPVLFDLDELAIFERALSPDEVLACYNAGRPDKSQEKQDFAAFEKANKDKGLVKMQIPLETMGYFQRGKLIPATVSVLPGSSLSGKFTAHFLLRDENNDVLFDKAEDFSCGNSDGGSVTVNFAPEKCGVYFLDMWLSNSKDEIVKKLPEEFGIGITVPLPNISEIPLSSPLAVHAAYEARFLGVRINRDILWPLAKKGSKQPKEIDYERIEKRIAETVPDNSDLKLLYTIYLSYPGEKAKGKRALPKDINQWKEYCRELTKRFKHKVYAWEIGNEPNAGGVVNGFSPEEYVEFLKASYEAIKSEDPNAIIVGGVGCPGFVSWNERIFKAGAGKYLDVVSIHNYGIDPIFRYHKFNRVRKVVEQVKKYCDKDVAVWNSESGWMSVPRKDNRPMKENELFAYAGNSLRFGENGKPLYWSFLPAMMEYDAACMQMQAILVDLGAGCKKSFKIHSPSEYTTAYNTTTGQPSLMGVAMAAMSSVLMSSREIEFMPLASQSDAAVLIKQKNGRRDLALFSDDETTIVFKCPGVERILGMDVFGNPLMWDTDNEQRLILHINSEPLYLMNIPDGFVQVPSVTFGSLPEKIGTDGIMAGELSVMNPFDRTINVTLKANTPGDTKMIFSPNLTIRPNETIKTPFKFIGNELDKGAHIFSISAYEGSMLLGKASHNFESSGTLHKVALLSDSFMLGDGKWWQAATPIKRNAEYSLLKGNPIPGVPWVPQWRGEDDLSFTIKQAWVKNKGLFVRVEVKDNILMPAPSDKRNLAFQYDCVELFFDGRMLSGDRYDSQLKPEQMIVIPNPNEEVAKCDFWFPSKKPTISAEFIGGRTADGYWIEGMIAPLANMETININRAAYSFDLMIDDMDKAGNMRKAIMSLHRKGTREDWTHWGIYGINPSGTVKDDTVAPK